MTQKDRGMPPPVAMPGPGADDAAYELWCRDFMERFHAEAAALRSDKEAVGRIPGRSRADLCGGRHRLTDSRASRERRPEAAEPGPQTELTGAGHTYL